MPRRILTCEIESDMETGALKGFIGSKVYWVRVGL